MLPVDIDRFWDDDAIAQRDPFAPAPGLAQPALGIRMSYETVFSELGYPFDMRRLETDYDFARSAARAYNERAEQIVGLRLLNETEYDPQRRFPRVKMLGEVFGCPRIWQSQSWWLLEAAHTPAELEKLLDEVERKDFAAEMFPENWDSECRRIREQFGIGPLLSKSLRGPVTLATSIYGAENLLFLIHDEPELAVRFRDVILAAIFKYYRLCDEASDPARVHPGFSFFDDNCALLSPEMYRFFGQPILQAVYAEFAPGPNDLRYQHSDSDMAHHLPALAETGMNSVNFGPNVRFAQIRGAMPKAIVNGTLAPFTFMNNDEAAIIAEVQRDIDEARATRGLVVQTAGSINNGSKLTSMRAVMHAIQTYGRNDQV